MRYEALEFAKPQDGQIDNWENLVITLVKAGSISTLLSVLKDRSAAGSWRVAVVSPSIMRELLMKGDSKLKVKSEWESATVFAGSKPSNKPPSEYLYNREHVKEGVREGKVMLFDAVPLSGGAKGGYSSVATVGVAAMWFVQQHDESVHGHVCLMGVKQELLSDLKKRKRSDDCIEPILRELESVYVGDSPEARRIRQQILEAATHDDRERPILIVGESGTGKEIVAREIHRRSPRRDAPFLALNCGAIVPTLFQSELFGIEKGAGVDGVKETKVGPWEMAGTGYLFLDEVGEIPLEQQSSILRALAEGVIQRVGKTGEDIIVPARIVAATKQDLPSMVAAGRFRDDLYFRLRSHVIRTPSLREHPDSIPNLANHLWRKIKKDQTITLPEDVIDELKRYVWPGNVRDLDHVLYLAHVRQGDGDRPLTVKDIRAISHEVSGMVPLRRTVLASSGQPSSATRDFIRTLVSLNNKILDLRLSAPLFFKTEEQGVEFSPEAQFEVTSLIQQIETVLNPPSLQLPESMIAMTDLKGRLEVLLTGQAWTQAKRASLWNHMLEPKLKEAETALRNERDKIEERVLSVDNTDQISLTNDILKLTEDLAGHTHEVWRRERELNGWKYGEKRDDVLKTNPDLIDYEKLPEKEKDLSRKQALGTLKAIMALGYSIERPDDERPEDGVDQ